MKEDIIRRAIGDIDDDLIEGAKEASAAPLKKRKTVVLKRVAVAALAVVLATFGLLMLNANVRAAVLGVFISTDSEGFTIVRFVGTEESETAEPVSVHDVRVGYIPEGLTLTDVDDRGMPGKYRLVELSDRGKNQGENVRFAWIMIVSQDDIDAIFTPGSFDCHTPTKINDMDAFMTIMDLKDNDWAESLGLSSDDPSLKSGTVFFGDGDITVEVVGIGISMDEVIKIAENITW